jgi:DNA-binding transcriptional ArsR family regulator
MAAVEVFRALGDPVRLEMIRRLSGGNSYTLTSVSSGLGISRQGARKHVQVLADARLVVLAPVGRDVVVQLEPASLQIAKSFIGELELRWERRLEALRDFVEQGS